jgi:hypothetical protein
MLFSGQIYVMKESIVHGGQQCEETTVYKGRLGGMEAALASMAALQKRIKILEYDHDNLKNQSLRKQLEAQEAFFEERHSALVSASERTDLLLANATETLGEISAAREENSLLKSQNEDLESILRRQKAKRDGLQKQMHDLNIELSERQSQVTACEELLGQILAAPAYSTVLSPEEILIVSSAGLSEDSMDPGILDMHTVLESLPRMFRHQDLETKRTIIRALAKAKNICSDLTCQIKECEKRRVSERQSEMRRLAKQHCLLAHDMSSFVFS